jgi:hypothetical protein
MDSLARLLVWSTYDRIAYEPIREDFLTWYQRAYFDLSLDERLDANNSELLQRAIASRGEAINYEPDTKLNHVIHFAADAQSLIAVITAAFSLIGTCVGGSLILLGFSDILSKILSIGSLAIGGGVLVVPGFAFPAYILTKHAIKTNEELIRLYNCKLAVPVNRITRNSRSPDLLTSFYVHHSSLCSTNQIPIIVVLGVIRTISPRIYGIMSARVQEDISRYYKQNIWNILGEEYAKVKTQLHENQD